MSLLLPKLILPPLLILLATLAGRRWGDAIGGWLVGLPLTSGPVTAFLAVQYGPEFAARATDGSLVGTTAQACCALAYAVLAHRGWPVALMGCVTAYAGMGYLVQTLPLPGWGFFLLALAICTLCAKLIPRRATVRSTIRAPWWDLPGRMVVATALVVTLTAAAAFVGPKTAGVMSGYPAFGTILAVFAHRVQGAEMARQVMRGMVLALYGFATFFFVLGLLLVPIGAVPAFLTALGATVAVQAGAFRLIRQARGR